MGLDPLIRRSDLEPDPWEHGASCNCKTNTANHLIFGQQQLRFTLMVNFGIRNWALIPYLNYLKGTLVTGFKQVYIWSPHFLHTWASLWSSFQMCFVKNKFGVRVFKVYSKSSLVIHKSPNFHEKKGTNIN